MYFTKFFALSAITTLAVATAVKRTGGGGGGETEPQCCQTVTTANDPAATKIFGLLGIVVQDVNAIVGINCSPITVVGGGNGPCSGTTVTCEDNSHGNLIHIGCVPVTV